MHGVCFEGRGILLRVVGCFPRCSLCFSGYLHVCPNPFDYLGLGHGWGNPYIRDVPPSKKTDFENLVYDL